MVHDQYQYFGLQSENVQARPVLSDNPVLQSIGMRTYELYVR